MYESRVYLANPYNSTMFTTCCDAAICNNQLKCPSCGKFVYGYDAPSDHQRGVQRWKLAFKK